MAVNYDEIEASPVWGPEIGRLYMEASPFITSLARIAYRGMAIQVRRQFAEVVSEVRVSFQDEDPYADASEMFADVRRGRLAIYRTSPNQSHPLLSDGENDMFRAVHDYYGHFGSGRDFSRHGEEAAWVRHSGMFSGLARRAMTSETRGQSSAFVWINGGREFPEQKAVLLPDWVSRVPEQWSR